MNFEIQPGHLLRLQLPCQGRNIPCEARVEHVSAERVSISRPERHGVKLPVEPGLLAMTFLTPNEVYTVPFRVIEVEDDRLHLDWPPEEAIERIQRRSYVRVDAALSCTLERSGGPDPVPACLKNLSGGGCALTAGERLAVNEHLVLILQLGEQGAFAATAEVRHCTPRLRPEGLHFEVGLEFTGLSDAARSRVIRHVFEIQRQQLIKRRVDGMRNA